jgi:conjugal transfer pilin signal peptidase TrbI
MSASASYRRIYWFMCGVAAVTISAWSLTAWFEVTVNLTHSLPGTLYVVHKGGSFTRGDLVAFHWHGGASYPAGSIFIKRVVGLPGERVTVSGAMVWVGDRYVGDAKPRSSAGIALVPAAGGVIAPGAYFVATPSPDSLDSRYALTGNIEQRAIIGRAYAIF